jgi:predicted small lipoprotein YifL
MRWLLLCVLVMQTATCGQKGPLTLPEGAAGSAPASTAFALT